MDKNQLKPLGAEKMQIVVQTEDVRVVEYMLQSGDCHPWHHHTQVTDRFYCLEGLVGVELHDPAQKFVLHPGDTLSIPPGVRHRASNVADGMTRYLLVQGVGRYDFIKHA